MPQARFVRLLSMSVLVLVLFMSLVTPAYAATISPNIFTDEDTPNSDCSLREAIKAAYNDANYNGCLRPGSGSGDTVSLAAGTYTLSASLGTINYNTADSGTQGDLIIQGASKSTTIIDGDDTFRLLNFSASSSEQTTINDLTVQDGGGAGPGGCINAVNGTLHLNRVLFNSCTTTGNGGGIAGEGVTVNLTDVDLTNNHADGDGGGAYSNTAGTKLKYNHTGTSVFTFSGNTATNGGAIFIDNSTDLEVLGQFHFVGNSATGFGGAVYAGGSSHLVISGSTQNVDGPSNPMGAVYQNSAATGSALYWNSSNGSSSITDICFGGNSQYSVFSTVGHKVDGVGNWWSSTWGPLVEYANYLYTHAGTYPTCTNGGYATTFCTASAVSQGDSASGDGTQASNNLGTVVGMNGAVAMNFSPTQPGTWGDGWDNSPAASGNFVTTKPGWSGCGTCSPVSAIDQTARVCSGF